ncbi:hypothetical protein LEP1GSC052_1862 [Leptospira kmetyi serovar Malaysia str. Bejo-Iso9]|nr:hypothetical protein LEP1GSC052_1862 [Leptospira kmetyi serovar Malaysia str. Bejo-Iso9]
MKEFLDKTAIKTIAPFVLFLLSYRGEKREATTPLRCSF